MRRRVLIVEDHTDNRESLGLLFERWGFDVALAENGESGIAVAAAWRPHIVLQCGGGISRPPKASSRNSRARMSGGTPPPGAS